MKLDKNKLSLAMARKCFNTQDLQLMAEMPRATVNNAITGRSVSPRTAGKIAQALSIDVSELVLKGNQENTSNQNGSGNRRGEDSGE